jgi:hypothetical protein
MVPSTCVMIRAGPALAAGTYTGRDGETVPGLAGPRKKSLAVSPQAGGGRVTPARQTKTLAPQWGRGFHKRTPVVPPQLGRLRSTSLVRDRKKRDSDPLSPDNGGDSGRVYLFVDRRPDQLPFNLRLPGPFGTCAGAGLSARSALWGNSLPSTSRPGRLSEAPLHPDRSEYPVAALTSPVHSHCAAFSIVRWSLARIMPCVKTGRCAAGVCSAACPSE